LLGVKKTVVAFDQKKANPLPASTATALQVAVPSGLRGGPVTLAVSHEGGIAYEDFAIAPAIKAVTPATGTTAGGTTITIVGSGFTGVDGFSDDPATPNVNERFDGVTIGGARVTDLIAVTDTEIVAVTPPGTSPAARIVVRTAGDGMVAASKSAANFGTAGEPAPVTATGVNLTGSTKIFVGSLPANDLTADAEAGTVTFTPPASAKAGASKVTFVNALGAASFQAVVPFVYTAAPTLTKLTPATGPAGTVVAVAGTGFVSGTTVRFGSAPAVCTALSPTLLRCTAPAGAGASSVTVATELGESPEVPASTFTYTAGTPAPVPPAPVAQAKVTGVTPGYGTTGTTVALKGTNLHLATKIEFTGAETAWVNAPRFITVGPGRVVVTVPAGVGTGPLRLTTPAGRVTSGIVSFTASVRPKVTSIDVVGDATYGVAAGDMLMIKGSGLVVGTTRPVVTIGGKPAPLLARPVPTHKTIVVKVPASVGGREQVVVTTPLGSATAEASVYFTPQIKSVKPRTYARDGGLPVTIAGTGFTGVGDIEDASGGRLSSVTFGGVAVTRLVVMSDKEIVAETASGSATVDLLLVRRAGTRHEPPRPDDHRGLPEHRSTGDGACAGDDQRHEPSRDVHRRVRHGQGGRAERGRGRHEHGRRAPYANGCGKGAGLGDQRGPR
jgi:hypothetical protein